MCTKGRSSRTQKDDLILFMCTRGPSLRTLRTYKYDIITSSLADLFSEQVILNEG